ncbi:MAG: ABC transporter ATP-binding protein [Actinobacteria bacterium]|nr:ABC transporter ATP-binding protein [Actinomycetota bacterium]
MPTVETTAPAAVACDDLRIAFGDTVAVDGLDLVVAPGKVTALLGPSGCGKTTTLRAIAGFVTPQAGRVFLHGSLVASPGQCVPPERRRVGMVFQDYALFPHLTVAENVAYGLRSRPDRARRIAEVLALVGLSDLGHRRPGELSGGQQQRTALARALAPDPEVILLDEPFSNLDAGLRSAVRSDVREILRRAGATAIVVTHDQEEALSLADEVAVMSSGRVHQVAAPHTLYTRPADRFVASFVGDADLLPGRRVDRHTVETPLGRLPTLEPVTATIVDVVIRPESLRLTPDDGGPCEVQEVTYFGHDQLVRVLLNDGTSVRSRLGPEPTLRPGERVRVELDGAVVAFADGQRTQTIHHATELVDVHGDRS